jgi:hypothetical protein
METDNVVIIDVLTNEIDVRALNDEEIAEREEMAIENAKEQAEAEARAAARISALAKLAELGLTEEEVKAL